MNPQIKELMSFLESLGVTRTALISTEDITFNPEFRGQCEQNVCGNYNKNWMCPPGVGAFTDLREKALGYKQGLVFQTVYQLEDSFDIEGMMESTIQHTKISRQAIAYIREKGLFEELLPLNVGPCTYCEPCAFLEGQECRAPEEAIASVESYGIDVTALVKSCGIPYNNGVNTVSCVGLILYR